MASAEISVVIPTFERADALAGCLHSLAGQTLASDRFEVIVCDDGSRDPVTTTLDAQLRALEDRLDVRVIRQHNAGPAAARNRGAAAALGRFIAFTDDDCRPAPNWLKRLLDRFTTRPDVLLGGGLRTSTRSDPYAQATQAIMDFVYAEQERRGGLRLFSTSNLALPAHGFARLGGFSTTFRRASGEDYDLCARWQGDGGAVEYVPDAVVVHDPALTLPAYWQQHFRYGRGLLRMRQRMADRGVPARRAEGALPAWFYVRLIASPVCTQGPRAALRTALVGLAQIATSVGVVAEMLRPEPSRAGMEPSRTPESF